MFVGSYSFLSFSFLFSSFFIFGVRCLFQKQQKSHFVLSLFVMLFISLFMSKGLQLLITNDRLVLNDRIDRLIPRQAQVHRQDTMIYISPIVSVGRSRRLFRSHGHGVPSTRPFSRMTRLHTSFCITRTRNAVPSRMFISPFRLWITLTPSQSNNLAATATVKPSSSIARLIRFSGKTVGFWRDTCNTPPLQRR